ncbi:MAG: PepSY-associated TM helix domain-containing protein [Steroidobacteraceae bacterium]
MSGNANNPRRAYWLKTLHQWHWISSAIALVGMLLFSFTGITLNHVAQLDKPPVIVNQTAQLPAELQAHLLSLGEQYEQDEILPPLPKTLQDWTNKTLSVDISNSLPEWSARELYLSMQRPGGDAWLSISLRNGAVKYQDSNRGWIAYLNDLHKGRYTGDVWVWFIDIIAVACLLFSITGLLILKMHANNRPSTWPLVALGLLVPFLIAVVFIH